MEIRITATQNVTKRVQAFFKNPGTGDPETGITFGDFSPIYARREDGSSFSVTLNGTIFTEVDAVNLPGFYEVTLSDTLLNTLGEIIFFFPALSGGPDTEEVIIRAEVQPALVAADLSAVTSELDDIKGAGFDTLTDSLVETRTTLEDNLADVAAQVTRTLGLSQENFTITGHVYDAEGNLTQSTVTLYPSRSDLILEANEIATYTMLASYDGSNRLINYSVRLDP